jgi:hypothetical protein
MERATTKMKGRMIRIFLSRWNKGSLAKKAMPMRRMIPITAMTVSSM